MDADSDKSDVAVLAIALEAAMFADAKQRETLIETRIKEFLGEHPNIKAGYLAATRYGKEQSRLEIWALDMAHYVDDCRQMPSDKLTLEALRANGIAAQIVLHVLDERKSAVGG